MNPIVRVSQKHIDNGERNDAKCCPIALAFRDAGYSPVVVTEMKILFMMNGEVHSMPVILDLEQFIFDFDSGREVEPFDLEIVKGQRWNETQGKRYARTHQQGYPLYR